MVMHDVANVTSTGHTIHHTMDRANTDPSTPMYSNVLGRAFAAQSKEYGLPADAQEHNRLNAQHNMIKALIDGLYFPPDLVKKALDPTDSSKRRGVMDVGAGSGIWAVEMAKEFPSAEVVGMDLVYPANLTETLPNCRFEIGDANLDWGRYAEAFDVVHMRSVATGIKDFKALLHNVAQTLRSQGVILLVSPILRFYSETKELLQDQVEGMPGWSAMAAFHAISSQATMKRGGSGFAICDYWVEWLTEMPFYTNVGERDFWIPIGPWKEGLDESERAAAELLRQVASEVISPMTLRLLEGGYDEDLIDRWAVEGDADDGTENVYDMEVRLGDEVSGAVVSAMKPVSGRKKVQRD
ncbi:hypothetical protein FRC01_007691, partial [Tulasnella sp. 417]